MARDIGARFACAKCGAVLVYEKGCPCADGDKHAEVCCGQPMARQPSGPASGSKPA